MTGVAWVFMITVWCIIGVAAFLALKKIVNNQ